MRVHENRILIEEIKEEKPKGALYVVREEDLLSKVLTGRIVDVGELVSKNAIGDIVLCESFHTLEVKIEGSTFLVLREGDVIITL